MNFQQLLNTVDDKLDAGWLRRDFDNDWSYAWIIESRAGGRYREVRVWIDDNTLTARDQDGSELRATNPTVIAVAAVLAFAEAARAEMAVAA